MKAKINERLQWKKKFYDFEDLLSKYIEWQKKRAPNSWQGNRYYLEQVVFHFFLNLKNANNANLWHLYHQEFRDYLESDAKTSKGKKGTYSYSTANHSIRTLNTFIEFLRVYNLIAPENAITCVCFPQHLVGKRSFEDVIPPDEFRLVHRKILETNPTIADFFLVQYHTGMRFNEGFGLPMGFIYGGTLEGPIGEELVKHGLPCYGYIVLESQPKDKLRKRNKDGSIARKPLKTKKKIEPKNFRTIPVTDKECWNVLVRRYKTQDELLAKQVYGSDKTNYLLFEDMTLGQATTSLRGAYKALRLKPKSYHCCRHSKATFLSGETRSFFLAKSILGHKSDVFEDYLHLYEMIALKAKQQNQEIDFVS